MHTTAIRLSLGTLLAAAAVLGAAPAHAATAPIGYNCFIQEVRGANGDVNDITNPTRVDHASTIAFDSALKNGSEVAVGRSVSINPVKATFTLPASLVDAVLEYGDGKAATATAGAVMDGRMKETKVDTGSTWRNLEPSLTAGDAATFSGRSIKDEEASGLVPVAAGPNTLTAGHVYLGIHKDALSVTISCNLRDGQSGALESVVGVTTTEAAPVATRPALVQTDVTQAGTTQAKVAQAGLARADGAQADTEASWLPLAGAGAGSILLLGAGAAAMRRRNN